MRVIVSSSSAVVKRRLKRIRRLMAQEPRAFNVMTKQQVIDALRKSREALWEMKLAARA